MTIAMKTYLSVHALTIRRARTRLSVGRDPMGPHRHRCAAIAIASALTLPACDRPAPDPRPAPQDSAGVSIRDSAGIEIVENHAPVWDSTDAWTVDPEPDFVLGGLDATGDSAHLIWRVRYAAPLSDGRIVMVAPMGDRKVLVFEPSGRLSAAFGREGEGPGEFHRPMRMQLLPGDTIVVWDQMFSSVAHFGPSGRLLRERRIDLGAVMAAVRTDDQQPGESVHLPLPDGSFLIEVMRPDWRPPAERGTIYRRPKGYVRIDPAYSAHSFGWWGEYERFSWPDRSLPFAVPFPAGVTTAAGGDPLSVFITNGDRYEIHQFSLTGELRRIVRRTVDPVPLSDKDLEEWKDGATSALAGLNWDRWELETAGRLAGRRHAAIIDLRVDPAGYLWAFDHGQREWSIFNAEGRWLGTIPLPDFAVQWIEEDFILGSWSDLDTGVQSVARYRLNRGGGR